MMGNGQQRSELARLDVDTEIARVDVAAVAVLNKSEVEAQLEAAHRYPRSIKSFTSEALSLATLSQDVAESCLYSVPRGGKLVAGPSVRLAEICASSYGNLHVGARVLGVEDKEIVAQGVCWDLQKNLRVTVETRRRITGKDGKRFNDDMITMTGNAAASIALRNAIFRVVPRAFVDVIYSEVRRVAVGDASTLAARREAVVTRLQKIGVPLERIFPRVEVKALEDVGLEQLEILIGLGTAIKSGERTIDECFPAEKGAEAKKIDEELRKPAGPSKEEPKPDAKTGSSTATPSAPKAEEPADVGRRPPTEADLERAKAEEAERRTQPRDYPAEGQELAAAVKGAKTPKAAKRLAAKIEAFAAEGAPVDLVEELRKLHRMHHGAGVIEEPKPAEREPGEEG
jgi:hypothetical protein